ncbi:unnamed protein product [Pedinophyceae sp. YPF-701]|nr:unnamed protein product [Pedinophyceae sp. YPF-701]
MATRITKQSAVADLIMGAGLVSSGGAKVKDERPKSSGPLLYELARGGHGGQSGSTHSHIEVEDYEDEFSDGARDAPPPKPRYGPQTSVSFRDTPPPVPTPPRLYSGANDTSGPAEVPSPSLATGSAAVQAQVVVPKPPRLPTAADADPEERSGHEGGHRRQASVAFADPPALPERPAPEATPPHEGSVLGGGGVGVGDAASEGSEPALNAVGAIGDKSRHTTPRRSRRVSEASTVASRAESRSPGRHGAPPPRVRNAFGGAGGTMDIRELARSMGMDPSSEVEVDAEASEAVVLPQTSPAKKRRLIELEKEVKALTKALDEAHMETRKQKIELGEEFKKKLADGLKDKEREIKTLRKRLADSERRRDMGENRIRSLEGDVAKLRKDLREHKVALEAGKEDMRAMKGDVDRARLEVAQARRQVEKEKGLRQTAVEKVRGEAEKALARAKQDFDLQVSQEQDRVTYLREKEEKLSMELAGMRGMCENLEQEAERARDRLLEATKHQKDASKGAEQLRKALVDARGENERLRGLAQRAAEEAEAQRRNVERLMDTRERMEKTARTRETQWQLQVETWDAKLAEARAESAGQVEHLSGVVEVLEERLARVLAADAAFHAMSGNAGLFADALKGNTTTGHLNSMIRHLSRENARLNKEIAVVRARHEDRLYKRPADHQTPPEGLPDSEEDTDPSKHLLESPSAPAFLKDGGAALPPAHLSSRALSVPPPGESVAETDSYRDLPPKDRPSSATTRGGSRPRSSRATTVLPQFSAVDTEPSAAAFSVASDATRRSAAPPCAWVAMEKATAAELRLALVQLEGESRAMRAEHATWKGRVEDLEGLLKHANDKVDRAMQDRDAALREARDANDRVREVKAQYVDAGVVRTAQFRTMEAQEEARGARKVLARQKNDLLVASRVERELEEKVEELQRELVDAQSARGAATETAVQLRAENASLQRRLAGLEADVAPAKQQMAALKVAGSVPRESLEAAEREASAAREQLRAVGRDRDSVRYELSQVKAREARQRKAHEKERGELEAVVRALREELYRSQTITSAQVAETEQSAMLVTRQLREERERCGELDDLVRELTEELEKARLEAVYHQTRARTLAEQGAGGAPVAGVVVGGGDGPPRGVVVGLNLREMPVLTACSGPVAEIG